MNSLLKKEMATDILGHAGRMISGSKGSYNYNNPINVTVFNANLCTEKDGKFWHGDLDLTIDEPKLIKLAIAIGEPIYVLHEMDARFENEESPKLEKHKAIVDENGAKINPIYEKYYHRNKEGLLVEYTTKELRKFYPEDYINEHKTEYKKEDYRKITLKGKIQSFRHKKNGNILDELHYHMFKILNLKGTDEAKIEKLKNVYLTQKQNKVIVEIIKSYLRGKGLRGYSVQREINWLPLSVAWSVFYDSTPKWAEDNCVYLRKKSEEDVKEDNTGDQCEGPTSEKISDNV